MKSSFAVASLLFAAFATPAFAADRYFGADLSFANEMDDCGAIYSDGGAPKDVYRIFKAHGANLIRIRIWNNAAWTKYSNLADVEKAIRRAHTLGMQVLLDFHYSDDWADGDKQIIPAAWANITDVSVLAEALYKYTYDTLGTLSHDGLMPEMVQVGNEINREILGAPDWAKDKNRPIDWERNARLLNAAIKAVRDAGTMSAIKPKVMIHIAQPENVEPWFAAAKTAGVTDFDVIGISYYPKWSHETLAGLGATINRLRFRYPKAEVMVVETGYPWTLRYADSSPNQLGADSELPQYGATPDGQAQYLIDLTQMVIANGGVGVVYWAPDWVSTKCSTRWGQGSGWENATLFDFDGNVLPGIDFMNHSYIWPVPVAFAFQGLTPPQGQPFYLWGDFLGTKDFAIRLPDDGKPLNFTTTLMPGQKIRYQVFDDIDLHARLIMGSDVIDGFAAHVVPNAAVTFDDMLALPAQ